MLSNFGVVAVEVINWTSRKQWPCCTCEKCRQIEPGLKYEDSPWSFFLLFLNQILMVFSIWKPSIGNIIWKKENTTPTMDSQEKFESMPSNLRTGDCMRWKIGAPFVSWRVDQQKLVSNCWNFSSTLHNVCSKTTYEKSALNSHT